MKSKWKKCDINVSEEFDEVETFKSALTDLKLRVTGRAQFNNGSHKKASSTKILILICFMYILSAQIAFGHTIKMHTVQNANIPRPNENKSEEFIKWYQNLFSKDLSNIDQDEEKDELKKLINDEEASDDVQTLLYQAIMIHGEALFDRIKNLTHAGDAEKIKNNTITEAPWGMPVFEGI